MKKNMNLIISIKYFVMIVLLIIIPIKVLIGGQIDNIDNTNTERANLAVTKFRSMNVPKYVTESVRNAIIDYIVKAQKYKVMERDQLDKIMLEQHLSNSDLFQGNNTIKLGKLISVRGIVLGSIVKLDSKISIFVRLVDAQTGEIIRTAKETADFEGDISQACAVIAYKISNLPVPENIENKDEFYLQIPWWSRYRFGINFGGGISGQYRDTQFDNPNFQELTVYHVLEGSIRSYIFFTKRSNIGLFLDFGWNMIRLYEYSEQNSQNHEHNYNLHYLTLIIAPVFRYKFLYFQIGPYFSYLIKSYIGTLNYINKKYFNPFNVGISLEAGLNIYNLNHNLSIQFNVELKLQFKNVIKKEHEETFGKNAKGLALYFTVSLLYNIY